MNGYACLPIQRIEQGPYALIPVDPSHIEAIRVWRNAQLEVLRQSAPITPEQQRSYYEQRVWPEQELRQPSNLLLGFLFNDQLIGYGGLVHIAWEDARAEVSFLLDPHRAADPEQYGREFSAFLSLVKSLAFEQLSFHRLFTETYDIRPHHVAILEGAGFAREGIMRDHVRIEGRPVDSIIQGCINGLKK